MTYSGVFTKADKKRFLHSLFLAFEAYAGYPVPPKERSIWDEITFAQRIPKRKILLRMGDSPTQYHYLYKGFCRQYYLDAYGYDITRGFAVDGEFCCTECHIQGKQSPFYVETLEPCEVLSFYFQDLSRLRHSDYMKDVYIRSLEKHLRERMYREASFLQESALDRYLTFCRTYPAYEARARQVHLASYLGMTPECLSRIRRTLKMQDV